MITGISKAAPTLAMILSDRLFTSQRRALVESLDKPKRRRETPKRRDVLPASLPPLGLSVDEAAAFVGVSPNKYRELERRKLMPAARMIDGRKVYDREQVHAAFKRMPSADASNDSGPITADHDADDTWGDIDGTP
jgi:hypothetical protein